MKIIQIIDYHAFGADWLNIALRTAPFADMLWFRIKNEPDEVILKNAEILRNALPDMPLVLSGRADFADLLGFQGVQLGFRTEKPAEVKKKHPNLLTGYSAHSIDEIASVESDFYTLSPIFFTEKDYEVSPLGIIDVSSLKKEIFALGGINAQNCAQLNGMGYAGIAGISFHKNLPEIRSILL